MTRLASNAGGQRGISRHDRQPAARTAMTDVDLAGATPSSLPEVAT
jgi:hypothetical protein